MTIRTVFFLSDSTAITAETLGHSLLTQFESISFKENSYPFINSIEKAEEVKEQINIAKQKDGSTPLIFSTLMAPQIKDIINKSDGFMIDFFENFTPLLEQELQSTATHAIGRSHGMGNFSKYISRIDALNFTISHDDGGSLKHYDDAQIILIGVSRSGKTPVCFYLSLHYGIRTANYPLIGTDIDISYIPKPLKKYRDKIFGLTISAERLHQIRSKRYPDSKYASLKQCKFEAQRAELIYRQEGIPFVNTTNMSVEEIAITILQEAKLERHL
jgi:regulator of PEP synthase PpsR (kinase-PPPase family)